MNTKLEATKGTSERTFRSTHPWINFRLDLGDADPELWLLAGDVRTMCELFSDIPLWPEVAARMHRLALVRGVRATTAIEGNMLSLEEVEQLADHTGDVAASREYMAREVENILQACNDLNAGLLQGEIPPLTVERICELNAIVLAGAELEDGVAPGQVRDYSVIVGRYRAAPPEDCAFLLQAMVEWLASDDFKLDERVGKVFSGLLKAIFAHLYLAWIHPFGDGNGRTARLIEFQLLIEAGLPTFAAHLLSNHYNETRSMYYRQLDRVANPKASPTSFVKYALQGFKDGLAGQWDFIGGQLLTGMWDNLVFNAFEGRNSRADARRRLVAMALPTRMGGLPRSEITDLTPQIAREYAGLTPKTVTRDLGVLREMELIWWSEGVVRPNVDLLFRLIPPRVPLDQVPGVG